VLESSLVDYLKKAKSVKNKGFSPTELITNFRNYLNNYFKHSGKIYRPKSILESRFTPAKVAFKVNMSSCGSQVNIITEMLRHIGYDVKKVHGSTPQSRDHAWLRMRENAYSSWKDFDPTQKDCLITPEHKEIAICNEWIELADEIAGAHLSNRK